MGSIHSFLLINFSDKKELIGIVGAVTVILLLVLLFIVCQRMRVKRRRGGHRPHSLNIDSNGKELVPLNSTRPHGDLPDFKRSSKMSNLEVSQVKKIIRENSFRFRILPSFEAPVKRDPNPPCVLISAPEPAHAPTSPGFLHAQRQ